MPKPFPTERKTYKSQFDKQQTKTAIKTSIQNTKKNTPNVYNNPLSNIPENKMILMSPPTTPKEKATLKILAKSNQGVSRFQVNLLVILVFLFMQLIDILINWSDSENEITSSTHVIFYFLGAGIIGLLGAFLLIIVLIHKKFKQCCLYTMEKMCKFEVLLQKLQFFLIGFISIGNLIIFNNNSNDVSYNLIALYYSFSYFKMAIGFEYRLIDIVITACYEITFFINWKIFDCKFILILCMDLVLIMRVYVFQPCIKNSEEKF